MFVFFRASLFAPHVFCEIPEAKGLDLERQIDDESRRFFGILLKEFYTVTAYSSFHGMFVSRNDVAFRSTTERILLKRSTTFYSVVHKQYRNSDCVQLG